MAEAEDVLLEAASHASSWVRQVWSRGQAPGAAVGASARRLEAWQVAWLGRSWPVKPAAAPATPGLVSRALRRPPPWRARPAWVPLTDGVGIHLPRPWLESSDTSGRTLVATLVVARGLARGAPEQPARRGALARQLRWWLEGGQADRLLWQDFPGLRGAVDRARAASLAARPRLRELRGVERDVEALLRAMLAPLAGPGPPRTPLGPLPPTAASPAALMQCAADWAAALGEQGDRGFAPVEHWGELRVPGEGHADPPGTGAEPTRSGRALPSAALPRPLDREPEPQEPERPGPFALAADDAHQSVDAPGVSRPTDLGDGEDPDDLASELARLESLPRVRREGEVGEVIEGAPAAAAAIRSATAERSGWLYPEWDEGLRRYRAPGCRVREVPVARCDAHLAARILAQRQLLLQRLRRQLEDLRPRRDRLRRQPEGDEVDVGAWVAEWADLRAGCAPEGRVYARERRIRRDVAVALLLDASSSTESWLEGGRRVIDVVKEAALVFAEALASLGDRHCILAFSGRSASDVRVQRLKAFDETPGAGVRARIGGLEPDGFTRLGAALRHATAELARQPARARLLLLISDGRPQDEDGYEGEYGLRDARQALCEADRVGVRSYAVTVDREARDDLARSFGPHGYTVLRDATALPERLPAIYRRLTSA